MGDIDISELLRARARAEKFYRVEYAAAQGDLDAEVAAHERAQRAVAAAAGPGVEVEVDEDIDLICAECGAVVDEDGAVRRGELVCEQCAEGGW